MATDSPMQLGMVGLGRMGANLVRRAMRDGHTCVVYDVNPDAVAALVAGATGALMRQVRILHTAETPSDGPRSAGT